MKHTILALASLLIAAMPLRGEALPQTTQDALAVHALHIFDNRCAKCHGPQRVKPKGRFGTVLDLGAMARDRDLIVPGKPEESELYQLIAEDEMPPADSIFAPMADYEKKAVYAWIAAGAPSAPQGATAHLKHQKPDTSTAAPQPTATGRLFTFLGKMHPPTTHFPIALLIVAALAEWLMAKTQALAFRLVVRFCLWLGALGAIAAAGLGWLAAGSGGYAESTDWALNVHRWLGTAAAVWALLLLVYHEKKLPPETSLDQRGLFRFALYLGAAAIATTGFFGGAVIHGLEYYVF